MQAATQNRQIAATSAAPTRAGAMACAVVGLHVIMLAGAAGPVSAQSSETQVTPPPLRRVMPQRVYGLPKPPPNEPSIDPATALPRRAPWQALTTTATATSTTATPFNANAATPAPPPRETDEDAGPPPPQAQRDPRLPEDRNAFALPGTPAGFDPQAFAIEVAPLLSERPRQLFRFQPYEPTGIRLGSFVVLPQLELATISDSNVFKSSRRRGDVAVEVIPQVRVVSNWRVHALEFRARGALTRFNEFTSEDLTGYELQTRGRIDLRRRTNIEALIKRELTQESRSGVDASPATAERADVSTTTAAATLNHRFNRLRLQLRGTLKDTDVSDPSDGAGATVSNGDRDVREKEGAVRAQWEFKPSFRTFMEVAINRRDYGAAAASDGIKRDGRGTRTRFGIAFGNDNKILRGEISIGYGTQRVDDARLGTVDGILIDTNVAWRLSGLTTALLQTATTIDGTTAAGSPGAINRDVTLALRHAFRRNLIATASLGRTWRHFEGIDLVEYETRASLDLEYAVNQGLQLLARYTVTDFDTNAATGHYFAHVFRLALRLRR